MITSARRPQQTQTNQEETKKTRRRFTLLISLRLFDLSKYLQVGERHVCTEYLPKCKLCSGYISRHRVNMEEPDEILFSL